MPIKKDTIKKEKKKKAAVKYSAATETQRPSRMEELLQSINKTLSAKK